MEKSKEYQVISRSFFDYLVLAVKGVCMGASDVVPGVSGGTMAFILGIYDELIDAIKSFDLKSLRMLLTLKLRPFAHYLHWEFLLALGLGSSHRRYAGRRQRGRLLVQ